MKKFLIAALLLFACLPALAIDDDNPNEMSLFYGYVWSSDDVSNHSAYGLTYERLFPESGGWGLMFKLERLSTQYVGADLDADFLDISGTYTFSWNRAKMYVPAGIGVSDSDGPGDTTGGGPTFHLGLGYKFAFTPNVGLRVEGRYRYGNDLVDLPDVDATHLLETTFGIGWSW